MPRPSTASRARHDDPADLSPEERIQELAGIFAAGLLRLPRSLCTGAVADAATAPEQNRIENSGRKALEVCGPSRPDGERG
jgi:hypothetical protein